MSDDPRLPDDWALIDWEGPMLCFGDDGHVVTVVQADGSLDYWFLAPGQDIVTTVVDVPSHELFGPLPDDVADRVDRVTSTARTDPDPGRTDAQ